MKLPRAVQEQADRAEAAYQQMLGNTTPVAPTVTPVATPVVEVIPVVETVQAEVTPATTTTPVTVDPWELKYKVLNGKYQSEVPRLAQELREVREQLKTHSAQTPVVGETPAVIAVSGMTPEAVSEQYGEDFASAVASIADAATKKIREEFASKLEVLEVDTAERARNDFLNELQGLVPNWKQIDADVGFTNYLNEIDAQTGRARREFFNEADRTGNAARIASFFQAYAGASTPLPKPAAVVTTPSVDHLISPDSSRHSEAPAGKKVWTRGGVAQFYLDAKHQGGSKPFGKFTAAEFERIDSDISQAAQEGRYIG